MKIRSVNAPRHVGLIMDGNRRWAKARGRAVSGGHRAGLENARIICRTAFQQGVEVVSLFAFSTENWQRSPREVSYLLGLFRRLVERELEAFLADGIRLVFSGRLSDFPPDLRQAMRQAEKKSRAGTAGTVNICLSYGGRDEIVRAVRRVLREEEEITEASLAAALDTAGLPDPDLIIRTSGEQRLSGFLTWQSVYSELYFSPKLWPDFSPADLRRALREYGRRQRRYGGR